MKINKNIKTSRKEGVIKNSRTSRSEGYAYNDPNDVVTSDESKYNDDPNYTRPDSPGVVVTRRDSSNRIATSRSDVPAENTTFVRTGGSSSTSRGPASAEGRKALERELDTLQTATDDVLLARIASDYRRNQIKAFKGKLGIPEESNVFGFTDPRFSDPKFTNRKTNPL